VAAAIVALAGIAAYARTLPVPFLFDDIPSIQENTTIRHLASSSRRQPTRRSAVARS
jgi:hypothetical protein